MRISNTLGTIVGFLLRRKKGTVVRTSYSPRPPWRCTRNAFRFEPLRAAEKERACGNSIAKSTWELVTILPSAPQQMHACNLRLSAGKNWRSTS